MRLPDDPDTPLSINLISMIDVIFVILAFVILAAVQLVRLTGMPVNLPPAATSEAQPVPPVTVTLRADGQIFFNQTPTPLPQIITALEGMQTPEQPLVVLLNADRVVPHGDVVAVMDQLRQLGGVQLAIATQPAPIDSAPVNPAIAP
ncbi:ExbD/TolR family protein [Spirulina major]|uniref:ExbD/TolR family protein n=1 Tax=Spirulina major TaxID=270636 RepID=UPI0009338A8D|nr:biopolymer transporter ExbD [Spirulina major]